MSEEEKKEYEELKSLLYTGTLSQYGKRKLIEIIEKQSKEIEELKEKYKIQKGLYETYGISKDKIKAKIEEVQNMKAKAKDIVFESSLNYIETELQSLLEKE